ncbi:hypothetical protein CJD36_012300 [Flavipsychrobacter stenotrophus]|uniref:TonB-dependent receptor plug domain-containing protein n=1 Tax=Flavipsychrobacter stenotrophus TaxID=2077091 RepID=A0A2S7SVX1_9BACT|nr:TonB-dependent receptor plug domain-containing protein [Flavipsychrobacter stenotrophus]PQJ10745.1 hypothetical protein CJD36_012300 [Flavipsychrobacter stenotrophus]
MKRILLTYIFTLLAILSYGQHKPVDIIKDTSDLSNLSIEELSKMKSRYAATDMEKTISLAIEAASRKPLTMRKSPSIISVITEEEIERSGARDLMDIIALIPGMEFNVDVEGVVALSFRGLWSNEGNISLQINGMEVNEIAYASLQFGNHYQVSQIKKIEIIRGPGSAIYGGCAEYAVINIITKKGEDLKGAAINTNIGQTAETYSRQEIGLSVGDKIKDLSYSFSGMVARAQRSNGTYTDVYNNSYKMPGNADLKANYFNIGMKYKNLSVQFIYDNYQTTNRDNILGIMSRPYSMNFLSGMTQVKYNKQLNKKLQLQLKLDHKYSEPWTFTGQPALIDSEYGSYRLIANTYKANIGILWDPLYWMNVNCGIEGYNDRGHLTMNQVFRTDSTNEVSYMNYAPFTQILMKTPYANITVGARYDISTAFGSAFNPRLGITKKVGIFNFKLLYASSFRAPAIESIQYGVDNMKLKPERSNTLEFEASVKMRKDMYLSVNFFDITTTDAIRYFVKTDSVITGFPDGYRNSDKKIGSQGVEVEYRYKSSFGFINLAYSYYTIRNKSVDDANMVPGNKSMTLGTAQNKLTVLASINVGKKLFISPSVNFIDKRFGYSSVDANENGILTEYKPQLLLNAYLGSSNLVKNCSLGLGISNITNERIIYPQAYSSLHAPLPGMGRDLYLKVNYKLPFNQKQQDQ